MNHHKLIIISGPSGVGKTTVVKKLLQRFPTLTTSVTYTTREKRPSAEEDKTIFYITKDEFIKKQQQGDFLEWAKVHDQYYGTARVETQEMLQEHSVLLNIDVQGAEQIVRQFPEDTITVFLVPESREQMIERIRRRGSVTPQELETRLASADRELARKDMFDYQIVNKEGKLNETMEAIAKIIEPYTT